MVNVWRSEGGLMPEELEIDFPGFWAWHGHSVATRFV
jgi:hypothetical protein